MKPLTGLRQIITTSAMFRKKIKLDYSIISKDLIVGRTPNKYDSEELDKLGVKLVINMRAEKKLPELHYGRTITSVWVPVVDSRFFPIMPHKLMPGVERSLETIHSGGSVFIGCRHGRHRSAVMAAAILIAQGMEINEVLHLLGQKRDAIDTEKKHIKNAINRFYNYWTNNRKVGVSKTGRN